MKKSIALIEKINGIDVNSTRLLLPIERNGREDTGKSPALAQIQLGRLRMPTQKRAVRGLIFDIDGTLIDSNDLHARAWQAAFAEFGKEIDYETIRSQIGKGGDLLVPDLLNAREMREFGKKLQTYRKRLFKEKYLSRVKPFPNVRQNFERLRAHKLKLALASSADPKEVDAFIEILGVGDLLEGSTSAEDAEHSKPYPEIFDAALEILGTPKKRTGAVGDTPYDILAAHRIALPIFALRCGGFDDSLLEKAEIVFDDLEELVRRFEEIDDYFRE